MNDSKILHDSCELPLTWLWVFAMTKVTNWTIPVSQIIATRAKTLNS